MKLMVVINQEFKKALINLSKQPVPLKTGFKLKTIIKKVDEEYNKYEELRKESLNKLAEKDGDGKVLNDGNGNAKLSSEGMSNFLKEMQDLLDLEIELPVLSVSELGDKVSLTAQEILLLDGLVTE